MSGPIAGLGLRRRLLALAGIVVIVGVALGVLAAVGVLGGQSGGQGIESVRLLDAPRAAGQASLSVGPQVGKLAPDFEISSFDGKRSRLSDFRGKAVYVNFWATWCNPCRGELPDVYALQQKHAGDMVVVAVNRREPTDSARAFLQGLSRPGGGNGVNFTVDGVDPDDTLYNKYRALGMPASFFIDRQGVVRAVANGRLSLEQMEADLAKALG